MVSLKISAVDAYNACYYLTSRISDLACSKERGLQILASAIIGAANEVLTSDKNADVDEISDAMVLISHELCATYLLRSDDLVRAFKACGGDILGGSECSSEEGR